MTCFDSPQNEDRFGWTRSQPSAHFSTSTCQGRPSSPHQKNSSSRHSVHPQRRYGAITKNAHDTIVTSVSPDSDLTSPSTEVFSPSSSASSLSSSSERDDASSNSNSSHSRSDHSSLNLQHLRILANENVPSQLQHRPHPRRNQVSASWTRPPLIRQCHRRQQLVEQLVDTATSLVALIWPGSDAPQAFQSRVISLRFFIRETLRRSRTSYSTLQLTLWYLVLIKPFVLKARCAEKPSHAETEDSSSFGQDCTADSGSFRAVNCGRRMFLAALILASKFLQDRNFTARAWSKITGLAINEITSNECKFLSKIGWNLHMNEQDFHHWNNIIVRCTESTQLGRNVKDTWSQVLQSFDKDCTMQQIVAALTAQHGSSDAIHELVKSADYAPLDYTKSGMPTPDQSFKMEDSCALGKSLLESMADRSSPLVPNLDASEPPPPPRLGGNLATPSLSRVPSHDSAGAPAVGSATVSPSGAQAVARGPALDVPTPVSQAVNDLPSGNWDAVRSEFPMDFMRTPESLASADGAVLSRQTSGSAQPWMHAVQNRAFGIVTPSTSFVGSRRDSLQAPAADATPSAEPQPADHQSADQHPAMTEGDFCRAIADSLRRRKADTQQSAHDVCGRKRSAGGSDLDASPRDRKARCCDSARAFAGWAV